VRENTLASFTEVAGGGEARRRPNSNFGRRLIFAQTMGKRIFPRGPFRLSTAWCSFYLLPPYTGVVLARTVRARMCVYGRVVRTCIPRSVYMISGPPLPLLSVSTMSAVPAAAMCGHVCVTARLLPNVRCKFPLSRLTRSAPTFRRIPA